jgi:uncharacterized repeat protein (TIGR02543 family)
MKTLIIRILTRWMLISGGIFCLLAASNAGRAAPVVTAVAAGGNHSLCVTEDGKLWAMGSNDRGQLGRGNTSGGTIAQVTAHGTAKVIDVAAGRGHSLYVTEDRKLWAMGSNGSGQLGLGDTTNRATPEQVTAHGTVRVIGVAAGNSHNLYVTEDGKLWAMGSNSSGQLGLGDTTNRATPEQVTAHGIAKVISIDAGNHSLYVTEDGKLWAMGRNDYGQLGLGDTTDRITPEQVTVIGTTKIISVTAGSDHSLYVTEDGKLWAMGYTTATPVPVKDASGNQITNVTAVTNGVGNSSLFITTDGKLWQYNTANSYPRLVQVTTPGNVIAATGGGIGHYLFITDDGCLWGIGGNDYGQLTGSPSVGHSGAVRTLFPPFFFPSGDLPVTTSIFPGVAILSVQVTGYPEPSLQWQTRADSGATWTNVLSATTSTLTLTNLTAADIGKQYRVRATNSIDYTIADVFGATTTLIDALVWAPGHGSQTRRVGQTATFALDIAGADGQCAFVWKKNDVPIPDAPNAPVYTTPTLTAADNNAVFTVTATGPLGDASLSAGLIVTPAIQLAWAAGAGTQTRQQGQTATFTVGITGDGPFTCAWQKNGATIASVTSATYTTPALTAADNNATYTVTVAGPGGIAAASATLTVTPVHAAPGLAPGGDLPVFTTAHDSAATLSVQTTGYPSPTFQWQKSADNGVTWADIAGAAANPLVLTGLVETDGGAQYRVRLTNVTTSFAGTVTTNTVTSAATILIVPTTPVVTLPALSVAPATRAVGASAGNTTFAITNIGAGTLNYTMAITAGSSWTGITVGATGNLAADASATVTVAYNANPAGFAERTATLTITADGAVSSPQAVTITQAENPAPPPTVTPMLDVDKTILTLAQPINSTATFAITANTSWTATVAPIGSGAGADTGWLAVSPVLNTISTGTITTTGTARAAAANNTGAPRTAAINIAASDATGAGATLARTIIVTQLPAAAGTAAPAALATGATLAFTHGNTTETYTVLAGNKLQPTGPGGAAAGTPVSYEYTATGNTATLIFDDAVWQLDFGVTPRAYRLCATDETTGAPYEISGVFAYTPPAVPATATVTFNTNAAGDTTATVSPATKTITAGGVYGSLPAPVRTNYIFTGWFTAATGGQQIAETTTVATPVTNHTLYAHWTAAGTGGGGNNNNGGGGGSGGGSGGGAASAPALALLAALFAIKAAQTIRENNVKKE